MTMNESSAPGTGVGDVGELYGQLARRLEQIVRLDVRAPDAVIEDACQAAWARLIHHRERVHRETVVSWLARTAVHEAVRLSRRDRRELSLESGADQTAAAMCIGAGPDAVLEQRQRLGEVRLLPVRQQRVLWLHALGLSYTEIAAHEGCTVRTVGRQMLRARQGMRDRSPSA
jgi:RNA polymerase sigma factor (sigma-70 family)